MCLNIRRAGMYACCTAGLVSAGARKRRESIKGKERKEAHHGSGVGAYTVMPRKAKVTYVITVHVQTGRFFANCSITLMFHTNLSQYTI